MLNSFRLPQHILKAINDCPGGCQPSWVFYAVPKNPLTMPYLCRCLKCLSYWEVTAGGEIMNVQRDPIQKLVVAIEEAVQQIQRLKAID